MAYIAWGKLELSGVRYARGQRVPDDVVDGIRASALSALLQRQALRSVTPEEAERYDAELRERIRAANVEQQRAKIEAVKVKLAAAKAVLAGLSAQGQAAARAVEDLELAAMVEADALEMLTAAAPAPTEQATQPRPPAVDAPAPSPVAVIEDPAVTVMTPLEEPHSVTPSEPTAPSVDDPKSEPHSSGRRRGR